MKTRNVLIISEIRTEAQGALDWERPGSTRTYIAYTTATLVTRVESRCSNTNLKRSVLHLESEDTADDYVESMRRAVQNFLNGNHCRMDLEYYARPNCSCCEFKPWHEIDDIEIHMQGEMKDLFEQLFSDLRNSTIRLEPIKLNP